METDDIPQNNNASYHGHHKVTYGTCDGYYEAATSNGRQDEAYATEMTMCGLDARTQVAREAVKRGGYSLLYYHMFRYRYDETGLAMAAGVWKWQLRQHFCSEVFAKLPTKALQKYADACQINIDGLRRTDT